MLRVGVVPAEVMAWSWVLWCSLTSTALAGGSSPIQDPQFKTKLIQTLEAQPMNASSRLRAVDGLMPMSEDPQVSAALLTAISPEQFPEVIRQIVTWDMRIMVPRTQLANQATIDRALLRLLSFESTYDTPIGMLSERVDLESNVRIFAARMLRNQTGRDPQITTRLMEIAADSLQGPLCGYAARTLFERGERGLSFINILVNLINSPAGSWTSSEAIRILRDMGVCDQRVVIRALTRALNARSQPSCTTEEIQQDRALKRYAASALGMPIEYLGSVWRQDFNSRELRASNLKMSESDLEPYLLAALTIRGRRWLSERNLERPVSDAEFSQIQRASRSYEAEALACFSEDERKILIESGLAAGPPGGDGSCVPNLDRLGS